MINSKTKMKSTISEFNRSNTLVMTKNTAYTSPRPQKRILRKLFLLAIVTTTLLANYFSALSPSHVFAATPDFEQITNYNVEYNPGDDFVTVTEIQTVKVNNSKYFYPANDSSGKQSTQDFSLSDHSTEKLTEERKFKKDSLKVWRKNTETKSYKIVEEKGALIVKVSQSQDIMPNAPYEVKIQYRTHELVKVIGNVYNIYLPGLVKSTQFETKDTARGTRSTISYTATLIIPENAPSASYIRPSNIKISSKNNKTYYSLANKDLVDTTMWIQLGTQQYTYFKLVQKTPKTDSIIPTEISKISDLLSTNIYRLTLPREFEETNQKTFYKDITPKPTKVEVDTEGNYIATFEMPANEESQITVEGYIILETEEASKALIPIPDMTITDYMSKISNNELSNYLQEDSYWQISHPTIMAEAQKLSEGKTKIYDLIYANYRFVIDTLEYDTNKVNENNIRMGAVKALAGSPAVCMEYSDLLIALLRAQGVPARPAFGYSNNPITSEEQIENAQEKKPVGHQWVQVWMPERGWVSIDPTWGETNREYIGGDLSHILWYTKAKMNDPIFDVVLFSANQTNDSAQDLLELEIRQINESELPDLTTLKTTQDITPEFAQTDDINADTSDVSFFLKTTPAGKALVVVIPVGLTLLALIMVITVAQKLLKKK